MRKTINCRGGHLFGFTGSYSQEIPHRPDHDIPGAISKWHENGRSYTNMNGRTYVLVSKAPSNSANNWINKIPRSKNG